MKRGLDECVGRLQRRLTICHKLITVKKKVLRKYGNDLRLVGIGALVIPGSGVVAVAGQTGRHARRPTSGVGVGGGTKPAGCESGCPLIAGVSTGPRTP